MPKGAHLHIHFNACLAPEILLGIAKTMDRMFITSDLPLTADGEYRNFQKCELQFSILSVDKERPGNIFLPSYRSRQTMKFTDFLDEFDKNYPSMTADEWLFKKIAFDEDETHNLLQTAAG